jgi:hypothetical protein
MIDDRTPNHDWPLPHADNALSDDVARLRTALTGADSAIGSLQGTVDGQIGTLQTTVDGQISALQGTVNDQLSALDTTVDGQISALQGTVNSQLAGVLTRGQIFFLSQS